MPLYGLRYLEGLPNDADLRELRRYVSDELPYVDFHEALAFYGAFVSTRKGERGRKERAFLGCNDRFFLLTAILGRNGGNAPEGANRDALHPWIYARCREVEANPDGYLDLWARYHYKSTIGTFAGIIQEVIRDPEITICILSCTRDISRAFLLQLQQEMESNEILKRLYADVFYEHPAKDAPRWSREQGLVVKRVGNPKESTIEAWGLIDAQPTSRHYRLLDYDDVVTQDHVGNPETIKKVTERWELSDNLGTHGEVRKWHFGTRYSFGDTYGIILERGQLKERRYPATEDGLLNGNPVLLTPERWKQVKDAQRSTVAAQMLLNPIADNEAVFRAEWLKSYDVRPTTLNVYMMIDPSMGRTKRSDRTAIALVGIDVAGNRYLLDGVRHRMSLSERWGHMKRLHKKWTDEIGIQHVHVGYERYGHQADVEVLKEWMDRDNYIFPMKELNWTREGEHSKTDRVKRLEPDFRAGRFYLPAVVWNPHCADELKRRGQDGKAYWSVLERDDGHTIHYRPFLGPTRNMSNADATNQSYRVVQPIKAIDEDRNVYDVTRALFEELLFFPFSPKDDFVDALSRIYDMEPNKAEIIEAGILDPIEDNG